MSRDCVDMDSADDVEVDFFLWGCLCRGGSRGIDEWLTAPGRPSVLSGSPTLVTPAADRGAKLLTLSRRLLVMVSFSLYIDSRLATFEQHDHLRATSAQ